MTRLLSILILLSIGTSVLAQNPDMPSDFLTKEWHKERRQKLRESMPANSVTVFFAAAVRNRANDTDYLYHQDPNFYYLTGYMEPHSVLFIFKDKQTAANGTSYDEIIFVQQRDVIKEIWNGRRLGDKGVKDQLGFEQVFNGKEFKKHNVDFSKFSEVLFYDFENDVRDDARDSTDLYSLIDQFKVKVNYPAKNKNLTIAPEQPKNNLNTGSLETLMAGLRGLKTKEEMDLLRKAIMISCIGQVEVMKAMQPGMSEREIQGIHEFVYKKYEAENMGYNSIVGAGHNGCILHYVENYKPKTTNNELVLMDVGAEYHGYSADITRTIPVNGKFSPEQKIIYDLVYKSEEATMKACKAGVSLDELNEVSHAVINKGLVELGIIKSENDRHLYYPHGVSHFIGLDVHDMGAIPGKKGPMKEQMTLTIEPGIYIPDGAPCDKKWWNIAVRIEDDFLVTKDGCELLSGHAPRTAAEIEAVMKQPSALDDFKLPSIETSKK